ncbi:hypothetical protein AAG906_004770 [Vitis piasezkii]
MESKTEGSNSEVTQFYSMGSSVRIFICGKNKEEYLMGAIVQPKEDDPGYRTWKLENSMVMSWLINSMTNDIGENFMYYGIAKEIWDADLRQGDSTHIEYFNILTRYWQQLDIYEELKVIEKERIYKFLLGLNKNLDEVHGRVLSIKPLPNVREVFSEIRREESRQKVMLGTQNSSKNLENSALVARGIQSNNNNHQMKKNRPWCDHCRKLGHTKETCWHLHEQLEALQKMFQQTLQSIGTTIGTASVAQKGIFSHALNVRQENHTTWIVDSGASDHMTGNLMVFHEYTPCHNNSSVRIADGTLSRALNSGKRIGNAEVRAGLYLLRAEEIRRLPMKTACVVSNPSTKTDSVVMLWHYRLGSRWFVTFVDDHTRVTWVFLMKKKSEVREIFENFNNMVRRSFQAKFKSLDDNAREYYHNILGSYLLENGIVHQSSCIDTPRQNGVVERKNRHLMEVAQSLMIASNVPKQL